MSQILACATSVWKPAPRGPARELYFLRPPALKGSESLDLFPSPGSTAKGLGPCKTVAGHASGSGMASSQDIS